MCISEAKQTFLERIGIVNSTILNRKNLHLSYKSKCSTSWLEIEILNLDFERDNNALNIRSENENENIINDNKIKITNNHYS
jgi:hypothetical protein